MSVRAMWKGVVAIDEERVPVKLYAAVQDRTVRFRLLERGALAPVTQSLVDPETGGTVPYEETRRALVTDDDELVVFDPEELEAQEPEPSRAIEVLSFVPEDAIDHRWYARPYYLGPDGDEDGYAALAAALDGAGREGVARWTMRKKAYVGALRLHAGYPMLVTLRHQEEVVSVERLERPRGKPLDERQLDMAAKLIGMLEAPFEPEAYHDEYRDRVLELIERKARGQEPPKPKARRPRRSTDLDRALEASLRGGARA